MEDKEYNRIGAEGLKVVSDSEIVMRGVKEEELLRLVTSKGAIR